MTQRLTLPETGCLVALWLAQQMIAQAPIRNQYSAAFILGGLFVIVLSRNISVIAGTVLALSVWLRLAFPISSWHDQHWMEWYSISSLATGHNIMLRSPLVGMSMASYLPQGDLFGGLFIALGIQKYWIVWQFIDPLLFLLPVLIAPCAGTLAVFLGLVWYWPFADYTNAGGNLEIELAVMVGAIACYRGGRKTAAIIFFAFATMLRQPYITLVPFVFLLLWHERDWARIRLYAALLVAFGGVYILLDPVGAYWYEYRVWDWFQDSFYKENGGLMGNYSVSSIPHAFGIPDIVPWIDWKWIYLPLTALGELILLAVAWRSRKRDTVLFTAVLAPVLVYVLARGYAQFHYILASAMPFFAMIVPAEAAKNVWERYASRGLAVFVLWTGLCPLAIFAVEKTAYMADGWRGLQKLPVAHTILVGIDGNNIEFPTPDGTDAHRQLCWMNQGLEFDFAEPVKPVTMTLETDHIPVQVVKGVTLPWATETEARGIITLGTIEYSEDGKTFEAPKEFRNTITYAAFPVTIELPRAGHAVRAVRLRARELYLHHDQWVIGNVAFTGTK